MFTKNNTTGKQAENEGFIGRVGCPAPPVWPSTDHLLLYLLIVYERLVRFFSLLFGLLSDLLGKSNMYDGAGVVPRPAIIGRVPVVGVMRLAIIGRSRWADVQVR